MTNCSGEHEFNLWVEELLMNFYLLSDQILDYQTQGKKSFEHLFFFFYIYFISY